MPKIEQTTETEPDPVRQRILDAAVNQFSRHGFEGASTRSIAQAADAAMSSITYQFGGKHGLYLAAADHIGNQIAEFMQPRLTMARNAVESGTLPPTEAILAILGGMVEMMLDDRSQYWAGFIIREQQEPGEAFERLYTNFMQPMSEVLNELIGMVRTDLTGPRLRAVGMSIISQAIAMRAARAAMMRMIGFEQIGAEERQFLRETLQANARAILEAKG